MTTVLSTSTMTAAASILWTIPSRSDESLERCLGREEGTKPEGAPCFLRSAMSQPISRLPLLLSAACGTAYDAPMSPLFAGATKIKKSLKKEKIPAPNIRALSSFRNFLNSLEERLFTIYEVFQISKFPKLRKLQRGILPNYFKNFGSSWGL